MPITVTAPTGVLTTTGRRTILPRLTDALIEVSGLACNAGRTETQATFAQSRFVTGSAPASPGRWQVPVCVTGDQVPPDASCHLLTEARQTVTVASGCGGWIFANAGARGYYRTAYAPDLPPGNTASGQNASPSN